MNRNQIYLTYRRRLTIILRKQVTLKFKMEDKVLNFEEAKINFQNVDCHSPLLVPKAIGELKYCAGQLIQFNVEIPVRKDAIQNAKIPHPPRSPASSNLLRCFLRHLASTVDVKSLITVPQTDNSKCTNDAEHETAGQFSCLLESSQLQNIDTSFFVSDNCSWVSKWILICFLNNK